MHLISWLSSANKILYVHMSEPFNHWCVSLNATTFYLAKSWELELQVVQFMDYVQVSSEVTYKIKLKVSSSQQHLLRSWGGTQELEGMDWSTVSLSSLTIGDPAVSRRDATMSADDFTSLDVTQMLMAPKLQSLSIHSKRIQLHNFFNVSRQTIKARRFNLILTCRTLLAHDESTWLGSLGHKLTRKIKYGEGETCRYWEYSAN